MPGPKSLPPRSSQRRNTNQQDEEPPPRTRSGRGPKSAAKDTKPEIVSPKANSHQTSTTPLKRKTTRQASTVTNYANLEAGNVVYGLWEAPIFHVFGIPREFLDGLKETKTSRKRRFSERSDLPALDTLSNEPDSMSEDESDDPPSPEDSAPSRGRGRGGRGSRGGRARGRGRGNRGGRGGRPAKPSAAPSTTSPSRTRPSRNAAPAFPLVEEDDDEPSNQESAADDAKLSSEVESENMDDYSEDDFEPSQTNGKQANHVDDEDMPDVASFPKTPAGSPPEELVQAYQDPDAKIPVPPPVPKISLPQKAVSRTRTPKEGTSTPVPPAPKLPMLAPEDDALSDSDFVGPWIEGAPDPIEAECEDRADYLLQKKYKPMVDVQDVISSLTKYAFAQRSTESLYALAENTQKILQAWQDEYLRLDARTAPHAHPPKKPCNGGRVPINPLVHEDMKEADLYSYTYNPKIQEPGFQDPWTQRPGHEQSGGRELRQRRGNAMLDSAAPSEDEEEDEDGRPSKRQRRATRRFEGSEAGTGTSTPKKNSGWGGARKKGVSKYAKGSEPGASATPEPDARGRRGKGLLHPRVQEMREESAVTSSGDEGSSNANSIEDEDNTTRPAKRGGRGGSRGGRGRGGHGAKGPRKRIFEEDEPIPSAHAPSGPPPVLQSMSQGQNQFTLDAPVGATVSPPVIGSHSTETVFQATPQPPGYQDMGIAPPSAHTPDSYMNTTPLSQYSNPYDDSANNSASGSRKKPRVKSEKRSQSMTIWWAERKARINSAPAKPPTSRSNSGSGRRGGKASATGSPVTKPLPDPQLRQVPFYPDPQALPPPVPSPREAQAYHSHPPPPAPFSAPSPSTSYAPTVSSYPPPPSLIMQPSPLIALPTTIPPPPSMPPGPGRTLAPAPLPPHVPMSSYPSPFGPRAGTRPKSNGPPPLAPAPTLQNHISPYPPMSIIGPSTPVRDMSFKVLVPGIPPDSRRESR